MTGRPVQLPGPFFVGTREGDIEDFDVETTLGHAVSHMEVPEVKEGWYRLFDAEARRADLGWNEKRGWDVLINGWSEPQPQELKTAVTAYLLRLGEKPPDIDMDIGAFVREAVPILRRLQEARKPGWIRAIEQGIRWVRRKPPETI
jgi:hypothetical protein